MKAIVVRYQAKPDRADENQGLIEAVFADLDDRKPEGFTYKVFRLDDGVSFIHVVIEHEAWRILTRSRTYRPSRTSSPRSRLAATFLRLRSGPPWWAATADASGSFRGQSVSGNSGRSYA